MTEPFTERLALIKRRLRENKGASIITLLTADVRAFVAEYEAQVSRLTFLEGEFKQRTKEVEALGKRIAELNAMADKHDAILVGLVPPPTGIDEEEEC